MNEANPTRPLVFDSDEAERHWRREKETERLHARNAELRTALVDALRDADRNRDADEAAYRQIAEIRDACS